MCAAAGATCAFCRHRPTNGLACLLAAFYFPFISPPLSSSQTPTQRQPHTQGSCCVLTTAKVSCESSSATCGNTNTAVAPLAAGHTTQSSPPLCHFAPAQGLPPVRTTPRAKRSLLLVCRSPFLLASTRVAADLAVRAFLKPATSLPRRLFKVVGFSPKLHSAACGRLRRLIDPIPRLCLASPGHHRAICLFSPPSLPLDPTHTRRRRALLPLHRTRTQARRVEVACILYIHCRGGIQTPGRNGVGTPFPTPRFSRLPTRQVAEAVTVSLAAHPCRVIGDQRFCL